MVLIALCPGEEHSGYQAFPGHYLPQLNASYCHLRWKELVFFWYKEHLRHAVEISQMMKATVDIS